MSLDPATLREAAIAFSDALQPDEDARRLVEEQLDQLARVLPAADAWAALGRGDEATLALLAGDLLVTISRETAGDGEPQLVVTGHPLRVTEVSYRQKDQHTSWEFRFGDRDPLRIEGRITAEAPDRAEAFAWELAVSIGWRAGEPASLATQEPQDEEPADAGSPPQGDAGPQRVTDLWGNPISKRQRRRG
jgi:hypothetical protein